MRQRYSLIALCLFCATLSVSDAAGQAFTFRFINQGLAPVEFPDAQWGNLDRDRDLDLVVSGLTKGEFPAPLAVVYINQGVVGSVNAKGDSVWTQHYSSFGQGILPVWMSAVSWMDVDNDGVLELILAGARNTERPFNPVTRIYRLVGSRFEVVPSNIDGVYGGSFDWGDFDNDGDADLLMTGEGDDGPVTRIFENQGGGSFLGASHGLPDVSLGDARFADYDGDGDLDVAVTGDTGEGFITALFRNDGGSLTEVPFAFPPLAFSSIDWADFDNDGDADILLAGGTLSPLIVDGHSYVFRNDGGGSFVSISTELDGMFYGAVKWGDYDNDGLSDVMLSGATNLQEQRLGRLYRNEGGGIFRLSINLAGVLFGNAALGDYDADGDIDILQLGDGFTNQYRNDHLRVNDPPTAPGGLGASSAGGSVALSWDAAFDEQTPSPGLTYNLRVGTAPGAIDIVNPLADLSTGRRLVAGLGNVRQNTSWTLTGLSAGTYYWSVQAIDNAFNGSAFSDEQSFSVSSNGGVATSSEPTDQIDDFRLVSSYPNPFAAETVVEFTVGASREVEISVYDVLGELVQVLSRGQISAGTHRVVWSGDGLNGGQVGAGFYIVRLSDGARSRTLKVVKVP